MLFKIAVRNLFRHGKNSIIVALLIAVVTALFFLGNNLLFQSDRKLKESFSESFTGDLVLHGETEESGEPVSLFGIITPGIGELFTLPVIKEFDKIRTLLDSHPAVEKTTAQLTGHAVMDINGGRYEVLLFGVEGETYFSFFPGVTFSQGRPPAPNERGVLLPRRFAERINRNREGELTLNSPVLLSSVGRTGFAIREIPYLGTLEYPGGTQIPEELVITDPQTLRALMAVRTSSDSGPPPSGEAVDLLEPSSSVDDLFGGPSTEPSVEDAEENGGGISLEELQGMVSPKERPEERPEGQNGTLPEDRTLPLEESEKIKESEKSGDVSGETGRNSSGWNFLLVSVKEGYSVKKTERELGRLLASYNVEIVDWRKAAGQTALLSLLLKAVFNGGYFLVVIAGVIAVIAIFLVSVFSRQKEIGTIRALGGSDGFIRGLILLENLLLSAAAGGAGILLGKIAAAVINKMKIDVGSGLISSLLGGSTLEITSLPGIALLSLAAAAIIGVLSSLYPLMVALRTGPAAAMAEK